jgi:hypothetical protein
MRTSVRDCALVLAIAALLCVAAGCSDGNGSLNGGQGNVRVMLTSEAAVTAATTTDGDDDGDHDGDDILSRLTEANATFASLLARNTDGELVDLAIELPHTVNLVELAGGDTVELPTGTLPPGTYDQLVVVITELELVFDNGGKIALTPPGGGWTRIVRVTPFEVIEGQVTTLEVRFRPRMAFRELAGGFGFFPDFECRTH